MPSPSDSLSQANLPRVVAAITGYLVPRWSGVTPIQLERVVWLAGTAAQTQEFSSLVYYHVVMSEALRSKAQERVTLLKRQAVLNMVKSDRFLQTLDTECAMLWRMGSDRMELAHLEQKTMWVPQQLYKSLYESLVRAVPEFKHITPTDYGKAVKRQTATRGSGTPLACEDDERALRASLLKYEPRGVPRHAAMDFVKKLQPSAVAEKDLRDNRSPSQSLCLRLFELMVNIKNRLDMKEIQAELDTRAATVLPFLLHEAPAPFKHPVLKALAPKEMSCSDEKTVRAAIQRQLDAELKEDMERAVSYMASSARASETEHLGRPSGLSEPSSVASTTPGHREDWPVVGSVAPVSMLSDLSD